MTFPLPAVRGGVGGSLGRLGYATLFTVALPLLLAWWATRLDRLLGLPAVGSPAFGVGLAVGGLILMVAATAALWRFGKGLPMSPYPPVRLVTAGVYRFLSHPLYVGAVLVAAGMAIALRSPSGLWVVTPTLALAAASFVWGYEGVATRQRLGGAAEPLLRLPPSGDAAATRWDRLAVYVLVFAPWMLAYEGVCRLGIPPGARLSYLPFERQLPVLGGSEAVYVLTYPFVLLAPLVARRRTELRRFSQRALAGTGVIVAIYLIFPFVAPFKPVPLGSAWAPLMAWERRHDCPFASLPAFHVFWALLAARLYAGRWPRWRWLSWTAATAIAISCVTTGMHAVLDVVAAIFVFVLVAHGERLWAFTCGVAERAANSWGELTLGPLRLLSHGVYAAAGAAVGLGVAIVLAGPRQLGWLVLMGLAGVLGAGMWAQLVEGSPQLLRPYGYFGAVAAAVLIALIARAGGGDGWLPLAAVAVGACFTQAIGRLRCLVQGCCHGREVMAPWGIRYLHPRSRVVRLAGLAGVPLHPTPLYSLLWMVVVGLVLLRLWAVGVHLPFVIGSYLMLVGLGRFVEEHLRGEPQTAWVAGLRVYQWLAIAFVVAGAAITAMAGAAAPPPSGLSRESLLAIAAVALLTYGAYGIDFPRSNRRFSRLA